MPATACATPRGITREDDVKRVRDVISEGIRQNHYRRDRYGINPTVHNLETAILLCEKISPDRDMIIAILLFALCKSEFISQDKVTAEWGDDIARLIRGLLKISDLYKKQPAVESDNFRNLLLTFAEDIRVIIIMLVDRISLMRAINHHPTTNSCATWPMRPTTCTRRSPTSSDSMS